MIWNELRYGNTIHDVVLESDRSCLTMKSYNDSFFDHVAKVIVFTHERISLFEIAFDPRDAVYCEYRRHGADSPLEELCRIIKNISGHEMIKKVNTLTSK